MNILSNESFEDFKKAKKTVEALMILVKENYDNYGMRHSTSDRASQEFGINYEEYGNMLFALLDNYFEMCKGQKNL